MVMGNGVKTLTKNRKQAAQKYKHRFLERLLKEKENVAAVTHSHADLLLPSSGDNSEEDNDQFFSAAGLS